MDHRLIGTKHPVNGKESRQIETQITKSQVNICNATVVSVKVYLDCRLTVYRNYTSFRYCKLLFSYLHIQVNLWVWQLCIITECCGLDENSSVLKKKRRGVYSKLMYMFVRNTSGLWNPWLRTTLTRDQPSLKATSFHTILPYFHVKEALTNKHHTLRTTFASFLRWS